MGRDRRRRAEREGEAEQQDQESGNQSEGHRSGSRYDPPQVTVPTCLWKHPYCGPGQVVPPSSERKKRVWSSTTATTPASEGAIAAVMAMPVNPVSCQDVPPSAER